MDRMRAMMRFVRREVPPGALVDERTREYRNLKKAVSGVVYLRNKLFGDLEQKQDERIEVSAEILLAVGTGDSELVLRLLEREDWIEHTLRMLAVELMRLVDQARRTHGDLLAMKGNSGAPDVDGDLRALEDVQDHISLFLASRTIEPASPDAPMVPRVSSRQRAEWRLEELRRHLRKRGGGGGTGGAPAVKG